MDAKTLIKEISDGRYDKSLGNIYSCGENADSQKQRYTDAIRQFIDEFLKNVAESGKSSFMYLQNVYSERDVKHQGMSLAIAVSEAFLGDNGVCRVHGGGFAGTIQAFVKNNVANDYRKLMDSLFGEGACRVLRIRRCGALRVI